jgi:D-alanine-D-alanine ligase
VTEIFATTGFYDYDAKYAPGGSRHIIPAQIPDLVMHEAMALAERSHAALGCRGISRTDFRFDNSGGKNRLVILELNTQPGMTPTSLVPEQALYRGMSFRNLVRWMVEDASCGR